MKQIIVDFAAAMNLGPEHVGGKGWNLGRLEHYGFPIPAGGVVVAGAYLQFLTANGLDARIDTLAALPAERAADPDVAEQLADLRSQIEAGEVPADLRGAVETFITEQQLLKEPLAVRSSATAEDSDRASFAGIHRSFLNVRGVDAALTALKQCYASLWTPQAVAYRRKMGLPDRAVLAAVVIQKMVVALAAGVAFSADPRTGRRDMVVINAAYGLGESVVSGSVEVDEYRLRVTNHGPVKLIGGRIGQKHKRVMPFAYGGTYEEELGDQERSQPAIFKPQQEQLALLVLRIQDTLGAQVIPQDVEWAYDGWHFTILQSRPITVLPEATLNEGEAATVWSTANLKDALPGVQTPLGWWLNQSWAEVLLTSLFSRAGYELPEGLTWSKLHNGRAYLNLSATQRAAWDAFGIPPADTNRALGGHQEQVPMPPAPGLFSLARVDQFRRLARFGQNLKQARKTASAKFATITEWTQNIAHVPKETPRFPDMDLLGKLWGIEKERRTYLPDTMIFNAMGLWSDRLARHLDRYFPGQGQALTSQLLAGGGGITSADQGYRLLAVAKMAAQEEQAGAWLRDPQADPRQWRAGLHGTKTGTLFQSFLQDFGHRGVYEMEIANPRWSEDPTFLVQTLRTYLADGIDKLHGAEEATQKRAAAEALIRRRLRLRPSARAWAFFVLREAREAMRLREGAKSALVRIVGAMRVWSLQIGARLHDRYQLLAEPADVFYLTGNELVALLNKSWGGKGLAEVIAHRKALRQERTALPAPEVLYGEQPRPKVAMPEGAQGTTLTGVGVSGGRSVGKARRIAHPDEGHRLRTGEILVAPSTDPAWTPLFLRAAGVVMEVGGYLSHGAIVAREYGVPAVVNVPDCMAVIDDGREVTVDGDSGKVVLGPKALQPLAARE